MQRQERMIPFTARVPRDLRDRFHRAVKKQFPGISSSERIRDLMQLTVDNRLKVLPEPKNRGRSRRK